MDMAKLSPVPALKDKVYGNGEPGRVFVLAMIVTYVCCRVKTFNECNPNQMH